MKSINEESLLIALKKGSNMAFNSIYTAYSKMLYTYLLDRLHDHDLCSDILQDVFVSLWEKREFLKIGVSLKAYLYQAVRHKIVDQYRRNHRYQKYLESLETQFAVHFSSQGDRIDHKSQLTNVMRTIDGFPCRMKEIFILSRFQHLSVNAIAEKLSISPQTVKNQLTKALHILRENNAEAYLLTIPLLFTLFEKVR